MPEGSPNFELTAGAEIGGCRLVRQLARSHISTIFEALKVEERGRPVALKVLRPGVRHSWLRDQFILEGKIACDLSHPNIVKGLRCGEERGVLFTELELLEGVTLARLMETRTADNGLPEAVWASVVASAAEGVQALYAYEGRRLVHCDISPGNVFVTRDGQVKVLDLGLVRPEGERVELTVTGELAGTYPYLSPERVRREPIDARSGVFSLGILLYEATTLSRLFAASTDEETLRNIEERRVKAPHLLVPDYPRGLEAIVMRALRAEREGRFSGSGSLARALRGWLSSGEGGGREGDFEAALLTEAVMEIAAEACD